MIDANDGVVPTRHYISIQMRHSDIFCTFAHFWVLFMIRVYPINRPFQDYIYSKSACPPRFQVSVLTHALRAGHGRDIMHLCRFVGQLLHYGVRDEANRRLLRRRF